MAFASLSDADDNDALAEIDMVPLIDVMLVLLVIFIVTAPLLTHAVKVDLPKASSAPNLTQPDNVQVAIDARGQVYWNGAELARAFGVSEPTVRHYLDILAATCMVRILPPWHEKLGKRQVKAPKLYLADSGLLHALLDIGTSAEALLGHPRVGASWEGFALHQIVRALGVDWRDCYHWRLHTGADLDLLATPDGRRLGFEIKRTDAPRVTPSMRSALEVLQLEKLFVVHAGKDAWPMAERIEAIPLAELFGRLAPERPRPAATAA